MNIWSPKANHPSQVLAEDINAELLPWLRQHARRQPWYLFVHYWDPHQAYNQPEPYRTLHKGGPEPAEQTIDGRGYRPHWGWTDRLTPQARQKIDLYNGELTYVDNAIRQVLDALRDAGVYDHTAVAVTADHGEDMEEHNAPFEHREPYETTVGVPLILKPPRAANLKPGTRVRGLVGHIDLMPSLLDLAGIEAPGGMDGRSWLPLARGEADALHDALFLTGGATKQDDRWAAPELAIRTASHKFICRGTAAYEPSHTALDLSNLCAPPWRGQPGRTLKDKVDFFNSLPRQELYDLRADPCETVNIAQKQPEVVAELHARLSRFVARNPKRFIPE